MMRKVKSAPSLMALTGQQTTPSAAPITQTSGLRRAANSCTALSSVPKAGTGRVETAAKVSPPSSSFAGSTAVLHSKAARRSRSAHPAPPAAFLPLAWELPILANLASQEPAIEVVAEEAEEFLVETMSRGVTGAECFEQFGWPQEAPPLLDPTDGSPEAAAARAQQAAERSGAQMQLAACLATPITDDRGLDESVNLAVRRLAVRQESQVQIRYVAELKRAAPAEDSEAVSPSDDERRRGAAASQWRRRTKRRSSSDMDAISLAELLGESAGELTGPPLGPRATSPETRALLDETFAAFEDDKNTLSMDEDVMGTRLELPPDVATVDCDGDLLCLEAFISMDAPEPEAPPASAWPRGGTALPVSSSVN